MDTRPVRVNRGFEGRVAEALSHTADPDLAARQLQRLAESAGPAVMDALAADGPFCERLLSVLGASTALGDHLVATPGEWEQLGRTDVVLPARPETVPLLRLEYRRALIAIAAADLTGAYSVDETMAALSALADATLDAAFHLGGGTDSMRLAVIAMGKCGGLELNYVSDVDVIFVCADDEDLGPTTAVAIKLMQICAQVAWPVDAALRPEGSQGPLVRTLAGHLAYYRKWARTWEFQALLKARPAVGSIELGQQWLDELQEFIWHAAERPEAVDDIRAMRRRIIDSVPRDEVDREIKRGPGGLRDVEFAVQLLQLVHGRADETLRSPSTVAALQGADHGWLRRAGRR